MDSYSTTVVLYTVGNSLLYEREGSDRSVSSTCVCFQYLWLFHCCLAGVSA